MNRAFPEYVAEHAALAWPACNGESVRDGVAVATGGTEIKCDDSERVVPGQLRRLTSLPWLSSWGRKATDMGRDQ